MDHYTILGVGRNASPEEIKQAYRRLASQHHPDKGGDTATFQKIQSAYEILSNPQKRQEHDNPNQHGGFPPGFNFHTNGFNFEDIFGEMFGRHGHQRQTPVYKTDIWLSMEQVHAGGEQILQFNTNHNKQTVKIQIPKGVESGQQLRYDNLIQDANLIVEFRIHPHSKFERRGLDLYSTQSISVLELIIGGTFQFTTIGGKTLEVKVNANTQPDSVLRLAKEGLANDRTTGDQLILIKPFIPDNIHHTILDSISQTRAREILDNLATK